MTLAADPRIDTVGLADGVRSGMATMPFRFGLRRFARFDAYERRCDAATLAAAAGAGFAYLWLLAVHPDARGRGLGRRAVEGAVGAMGHAGFPRVSPVVDGVVRNRLNVFADRCVLGT